MDGLSIGLFGATGQIGRCLTKAFATGHDLSLFARRPGVVEAFLEEQGLEAAALTFDRFAQGRYDLIINAVGHGDPRKIRLEGPAILETAAYFDDLALAYLRGRPETGYLYLSTGAIYGENYRQALVPEPMLRLSLTRAEPGAFYPLAKRIAEMKHRLSNGLKIADIRIFGFISGELGLDGGFFLSQVLQKLIANEVFETGPANFVRDYASSEDLVRLVRAIVFEGVPNGEFDLYSAAPTTKAELLGALQSELGLRVEIVGGRSYEEMRDVPALITRHLEAGSIGYRPAGTSLENVLEVARAIRDAHLQVR